MGVFGLLIGWDQTKAASNAALANYLVDHLSVGQKEQIVERILCKMRQSNPFIRNKSTTEVLSMLNRECRVTQMNCIALACDDLGIPPPLPKTYWFRLRSPWAVGGHTKDRDVFTQLASFERDHHIKMGWPGDNVNIDFRG